MSREATLDWLARFQADFARVLRTPLDPRTGTLRAQPDAYPEACVAAALAGPHSGARERLAVYNRQYWFRLLSVLHNELPLTSRLFGLWHFNQYALRFLEQHPPRHVELRRVTDGFEAFLEGALPREPLQLEPARAALPRAALLQAAQLDLRFARVFAAPATTPLNLAGVAEEKLPQLRLTPTAAYALFVEQWPLVSLRHDLHGDQSDAAVPLPAAHPAPRAWAVFRTDGGVTHAPLAPAQARLYELLERLPLADALAQLEHETPEAERDSLPELTRRWLALAAAHGFFARAQPNR